MGKEARSRGEREAGFAATGVLEHVTGSPRIPHWPYAKFVLPVVISTQRPANDLSAGRLIER